MNRSAIMAMALTCSALPTQAIAQEISGEVLLGACREFARSESNYATNPNAMFCLGMIAGIWQSRELVVQSLRGQGPAHLVGGCIPRNVTIGQLAKVTIQHLEAHPEAHHLPAAAPVWLAISTAFVFQCEKP